ncbi:MAG: glycosyl hydrolase [Pseudonocardia sp.]
MPHLLDLTRLIVSDPLGEGLSFGGRQTPYLREQFFRRVVAAMRSAQGQKFLFDFDPSRGRDAIPWTECYPGDDVVDIIGMDTYDQPQGATFDTFVSEDYGLQDHVDFATQRGKPISFPEWGLLRNGDNPEYIRRMAEWIQTPTPSTPFTPTTARTPSCRSDRRATPAPNPSRPRS